MCEERAMWGDKVSWNTVLSVFLFAENAPLNGASAGCELFKDVQWNPF